MATPTPRILRHLLQAAFLCLLLALHGCKLDGKAALREADKIVSRWEKKAQSGKLTNADASEARIEVDFWKKKYEFAVEHLTSEQQQQCDALEQRMNTLFPPAQPTTVTEQPRSKTAEKKPAQNPTETPSPNAPTPAKKTQKKPSAAPTKKANSEPPKSSNQTAATPPEKPITKPSTKPTPKSSGKSKGKTGTKTQSKPAPKPAPKTPGKPTPKVSPKSHKKLPPKPGESSPSTPAKDSEKTS